ncbi:MAG: protein kinase [Planctomycetes bacterium]|nr:protein kinase [Planctomycetota bacterium]
MPISIECKECGRAGVVPDSAQGQPVECECGFIFTASGAPMADLISGPAFKIVDAGSTKVDASSRESSVVPRKDSTRDTLFVFGADGSDITIHGGITHGEPTGSPVAMSEETRLLIPGRDTETIGPNIPQVDPKRGSDAPDVPEDDKTKVTDKSARHSFTSTKEIVGNILLANSSEDRYEIEKSIGRGGMGNVLLVRDKALEREVALKAMRVEAKAHLARFIEEAQVTSQLEHPGIVPVHDIGVNAKGEVYFTMKLIRGFPLSKVLAARKYHEGLRTGAQYVSKRDVDKYGEDDLAGIECPTRERLLTLFIKIAEAVAFSHSRGVIHRDLKPDNVMIGDFGEALVVDWGLAKVLGKEESQEVSSSVRTVRTEDESTHSQMGTVMGTIGYMSPEQAEGRGAEVDQRSDVFSLGAILYEILALSLPFKSTNLVDLLHQFSSKQLESPRKRAPELNIPFELDAICMKALAVDHAERYGSVAEMAEDLTSYFEGRSVSAYNDPLYYRIRKWLKRNRVAVALVLIPVLALVFGVYVTRSIDESRTAGEVDNMRTDAIALARKFADAEGGEFFTENLRALRLLDQVLEKRPEDEVALAEKFRLTLALGERASISGDYTFARFLAQQAAGTGAGDDEARNLLGKIDVRQNEHIRRDLARVDEVINEVSRHGWLNLYAEDVYAEIGSMRGDHTESKLLPLLADENEWVRDLAITCLGRLKSEKAADALTQIVRDWTVSVSQGEPTGIYSEAQVISAVKSLSQIGVPEADPVVFAARKAAGESSPFFARTKRSYRAMTDMSWYDERVASGKIDALIERGLAYAYKEDKFHAARDAAELLVRSDSPEVLKLAGRVAILKGSPSEALQLLENALTKTQNDVEAMILLAEARTQLGMYSAARSTIAAAKSAAPDNPVVHLLEGALELSLYHVYHASGDPLEPTSLESAYDAFTIALRISPKYARAYHARGQALYFLKRPDEAISDYTRAIQYHPDEATYYIDRGTAYFEKNDYHQAIADYTTALSFDTKQVLAYYNRALCLRHRGEPQDAEPAIEDFTRVLKIDPENDGARQNRAEVYFDLERWEDALSDFELLERSASSRNASILGQGRTLAKMSRFEEASQRLTTLLRMDGSNLGALEERSKTFLALGDLEGSLADEIRILALSNDKTAAYARKGRVLLLMMDFEGARDDLGEAYARDHDTFYIARNYALALLCLGEFEKSREVARGLVEGSSAGQREFAESLVYHANLLESQPARTGVSSRAVGELLVLEESIYAFEDEASLARVYEGLREKSTALIGLCPEEEKGMISRLLSLRGIANLFGGDRRAAIDDFEASIDLLGETGEGADLESRVIGRRIASDAYNAACAASILSASAEGYKEKALAFLEISFEHGWTNIAHLESDPDLENIRDSDEFRALIEKYR